LVYGVGACHGKPDFYGWLRGVCHGKPLHHAYLILKIGRPTPFRGFWSYTQVHRLPIFCDENWQNNPVHGVSEAQMSGSPPSGWQHTRYFYHILSF